MNYSFFWLVAVAYDRKLIDRERFVSLWSFVQSLEEEKNKMAENKACPFCRNGGGVDTINRRNGVPAKFRVQCAECYASTRDTKDEAWDVWNKRKVESINLVINDDMFVFNSRLYSRNQGGSLHGAKRIQREVDTDKRRRIYFGL